MSIAKLKSLLIGITNEFLYKLGKYSFGIFFCSDKRDGMSREGSGRVAVYKLTGLIRSYTLECNYNSGRLVNTIPARVRDGNNKPQGHMFVPPKYTPTVFEEVHKLCLK